MMKKKTYEICSDLQQISLVVNDIINSVKDLMDSIHLIEVALYEAIYNAIEHGNLDITRKKKENLVKNGKYDEYLREKIINQEYCKKKVKIYFSVSENILSVRVEDEGKGFDWKKEMEALVEEGKNRLGKYNGFGLKIIASAFDEIKYNRKGNKMTLIKHLN